MTSNIRNFALIAHVDHGKSTLADALMRACGQVDERKMQSQMLDSMDIERERGITIKAQTVRLNWRAEDGQDYILNLLDTPGHVDFSYEVSRSLAACEGSVLLIDSTQGIEAQTLANAWAAVERDHDIIPVFNKIDLPASDLERSGAELEQALGLDPTQGLPVSAKTGDGVKALLAAIVARLPAPSGSPEKELQALLVDSWYDSYLGVIILVRIRQGRLKRGMKLRMMAVATTCIAEKVGIFTPFKVEKDYLGPGDIGFVAAGIKAASECQIGDTITDEMRPTNDALPGFQAQDPTVFCGFFPVDGQDYPRLRESLTRLALNDSSFTWEPENSGALGHGFRCGFHGLLHLEVIQERLSREFDLDIVLTAPSVTYRFTTISGDIVETGNPVSMPSASQITQMEEPWIDATIIVPEAHFGAVMDLCQARRCETAGVEWTGKRALARVKLPLAEVVFDFYDSLKSASRGYASFNYQPLGYRPAPLVRIDFLINEEKIDAFSFIAHRDRADRRARFLCEKLKDLIPRQLFKVPIQAAIGAKVIARETVPAMRKDVTAKCYGGDVSRKRKLLDKQKEGKKKMKQFGRVSIPHNALITALRSRDDDG